MREVSSAPLTQLGPQISVDARVPIADGYTHIQYSQQVQSPETDAVVSFTSEWWFTLLELTLLTSINSPVNEN